MIDIPNYYSYNDSFMSYPIVKPNLITGEGRMKLRGRDKIGDLKKKAHRKMAKKSRRVNRR